MGLLGRAFPWSFSNTQALLDQLLGVEYSFSSRSFGNGEDFIHSRAAIARIRERLRAALEHPTSEALATAGGPSR